MTKTCAVCGKKFKTNVVISKNEGKSYCSEKCFNSPIGLGETISKLVTLELDEFWKHWENKK